MKMKCKECDFYHEENNTCQSKKCCTGGDGTVTWFDKLFCTPYKHTQTTFVYCECGNELVSNHKEVFEDEYGLVNYTCVCGKKSKWDFETPTPIRITKDDIDYIEEQVKEPKKPLPSMDELLDRAYQKGREDKYEEITSEYMLLTEEQVKDIRNDAIDECIRITNECCWKDAKMLFELFEQIKEGK